MPQGDLLEQAKQLAKQGRYEDALGIFQKQGGTDGYYGAAACLYRLGELEAAKVEISNCLQLDPQDSRALDLQDRVAAAEQAAAAAERRGRSFITGKRAALLVGFLLIVVFVIAVFLVVMWFR